MLHTPSPDVVAVPVCPLHVSVTVTPAMGEPVCESRTTPLASVGTLGGGPGGATPRTYNLQLLPPEHDELAVCPLEEESQEL